MTTLQPKPVHLAGTISHGDWLDAWPTSFPQGLSSPSPSPEGDTQQDVELAQGEGSSIPR